jgi:ribosome-associated translation inhibitor RaiA
MQIAPKITFHNLGPSEAIESHVRRRLADLEKLFPRIIGCDVVIEAPQKRKLSGRAFKIHLKVAIPGPDIDVTRDIEQSAASDDVNLAIHDAFTTAGRILVERKREAVGRRTGARE